MLETGDSRPVSMTQFFALVKNSSGVTGCLYAVRVSRENLWHVRRNGDYGLAALCGYGDYSNMTHYVAPNARYEVCETCWKLTLLDKLAC